MFQKARLTHWLAKLTTNRTTVVILLLHGAALLVNRLSRMNSNSDCPEP